MDERSENTFGCFPFSTRSYDRSSFPINSEHADFLATGLDRDCHILDERIYSLDAGSFTKQLGRLEGELLQQFKDYAGLNGAC